MKTILKKIPNLILRPILHVEFGHTRARNLEIFLLIWKERCTSFLHHNWWRLNQLHRRTNILEINVLELTINKSTNQGVDCVIYRLMIIELR